MSTSPYSQNEKSAAPMAQLKSWFNRRLTPLEAFLVIAAAVVLAGVGYLGYQFATAKMLQARVEAAIPKVCVKIREQRLKLVKAIEAYKAQFGVYPPDHVVRQDPLVIDPVTNTLLYELAGVIYNPTNKTLRVHSLEPADADYVKGFFQINGFKNYAESPQHITRFLTIDPLPARQLHDDPDVFVLGFPPPNEVLDPQTVWEFDTTPWCYVSSSPTNNPGKFDLWIELKTKTRSVVIGNWKDVE